MTLGDRYTDNMDQIYRLTIKFVLETVVNGYEMAEERERNENLQKLNSTTEVPTDQKPCDVRDNLTSSGGSCPISNASSSQGCPFNTSNTTTTSARATDVPATTKKL